MHNHNFELSPQSSNSQLPQNSSQYSNYLPQQDEDSPLEVQGEQPQNFDYEPQATISSRFRQDKMVNLTIILIIFISIIELAPSCYGVYYFVFQSGFKKWSLAPFSKPLKYMKANLNADPIMEIQIMERGSTCPSGFKLLKLGAWPGTKAGCLCENGNLYSVSCDQVKAEKCEKDIPSTLLIDMFEWDASIWCVKRAVLGTDYLRKAECPAEYKECYPGGCFSSKECPITKIEIGSNGVLSLAKAPEELPIINIQVTFGDTPCFIQDLFAQNIKNFTYKLSAVQENSCNKYGSNSQFSTIIASQTAYTSFTENYLPYPTMHLPYFEGNATATSSILSSMVRMETVKHAYCLDINENSIHDYSEITESSQWGFVGSLALFFIRCYCFFIIFSPFHPRTRTELFSESSKLVSKLRTLNLISFVLGILMLIPFHGLYQGFQAMKDDFQRYNELECFAKGQGSMVINDFLEMLKDIEGGFLIYWVFLVIHVSYIFIHILFYIGKKISS